VENRRENKRNLLSEWLLSRPRFEPSTFRTRAQRFIRTYQRISNGLEFHMLRKLNVYRPIYCQLTYEDCSVWGVGVSRKRC
jgi:hypothetical protein